MDLMDGICYVLIPFSDENFASHFFHFLFGVNRALDGKERNQIHFCQNEIERMARSSVIRIELSPKLIRQPFTVWYS